MAHFDSLATPILSTSPTDNFIPINTDATPHIINGHISQTNGDNFLTTSTTYDDLPSVISVPLVPKVSVNTTESTPIMKTRLWQNRLYVKRITRNEKFKELHRNVFPELSHHQMVFVYFNYYTNKSTPYDTTAELNSWNAPDKIKDIVQTRMAQQILSDH